MYTSNLKWRLSLLYFLQFAVWGCYLTCFSQLLGAGGLGSDIAWFYSAIGLVSLLSPALAGHMADRFISPQRMLALCHGGAALAMLAAWLYAASHPQLEFVSFFMLYLLFLLFYMPTMALSNTSTFALLRRSGREPAQAFPAIRIWGTAGFVLAMWFVNSAYFFNGHFGFTLSDSNPASAYRFQYTHMQLLATALTGVVASLYAMTLPVTQPGGSVGTKRKSLADILGFSSFRLMKVPTLRTFLIFAAFAGVCLQISNGFATPYITHFAGMAEYAGSLAAGNATMLFSLSQISEAACLLLVGVAMRRLGIRLVISIALLAWCLRFALLGLGNPGGGLWMLALSMIVYGIAFNFFTIAGHLYMEQQSTKATKGFGQGLMMLMSNGIGATVGTAVAGAVVNHWCGWQVVAMPGGHASMRLFMGEWIWPWTIFALYALAVGLMFYICFRPDRRVALQSA